MIDALNDARSMLGAAGYTTNVLRVDEASFAFEDDSLIGFVRVFPTVGELLTSWRSSQEAFIKRTTHSLLRDPAKAWNLYAIFLSGEVAKPEHCAQLIAVEEDFQSTRKIAKAGVASRSELAAALAPLLPLQSVLHLEPGDGYARLRDRLGDEKSVRRLFLSEVPVQEIVKLLMEAP